MIRLIAAKLLSYRSFHKFTVLHVAMILVLGVVVSRFSMNIQGIEVLRSLFAFPEVWRTVTGLSRWLFYIPAFFVIQLVCAEFELKVVRSQIIAGLERWQIVTTWVAQNLLLSLIAVVTTLLSGFYLGYTSIEQTGGGGSFAESAAMLLRCELGYILYGMAFLNAAVLCGVLLRRPVPAIVLLVMGPLLVEPALTFALQHYDYGAVAPYLPFASLGTLVTWHDPNTLFDPLAITTFVAVAYGIAAAAVAWLFLEKADL